MKKYVLFVGLLITATTLSIRSQAQVRVGVNININSQPGWDPVYYDDVYYPSHTVIVNRRYVHNYYPERVRYSRYNNYYGKKYYRGKYYNGRGNKNGHWKHGRYDR